jgi:hypothetical protein
MDSLVRGNGRDCCDYAMGTVEGAQGEQVSGGYCGRSQRAVCAGGGVRCRGVHCLLVLDDRHSVLAVSNMDRTNGKAGDNCSSIDMYPSQDVVAITAIRRRSDAGCAGLKLLTSRFVQY